MAVCSIVTNTEPTVHEPHLPPPPSELPAWGPGLDVGLRSSEEETEGTVGPAQVPPRPGRGPCCVRAPGHCPRVTALSPLSVSGHSVDPGLAGLLGQRAPRSKQPFMVTFFRASSSPIRAPRAVRPLKSAAVQSFISEEILGPETDGHCGAAHGTSCFFVPP